MFCTPEPPNCAQRIEKTHLSESELTIMPPLEVEREKKTHFFEDFAWKHSMK